MLQRVSNQNTPGHQPNNHVQRVSSDDDGPVERDLEDDR